jgi:hypothetical protein
VLPFAMLVKQDTLFLLELVLTVLIHIVFHALQDSLIVKHALVAMVSLLQKLVLPVDLTVVYVH